VSGTRPLHAAGSAALVAACIALAACRDAVDLSTLPDPELAAADPSVREQLAAARRSVEALARERDRPALGDAVGELARLYHAYELLDAAGASYALARELDPEDYRWPHCQGFLLQGRGDLDGAAEAYGRALALEPGNLAALVRLADVELARGRLDPAAQLLASALAVDGAAVVHFGLGRVALERGRFGEAVDHFERALAAEPAATRIHHPLGLALRGAGDLERARQFLERRGSQDPTLHDPPIAEIRELQTGGGAALARGLAALHQGDPAAAAAALEALVARRPDDVTARHNLAVARGRSGDVAGAEREYLEIVARWPHDAAARYAVANILAARGQLEPSLEHYRAALESAPDFKQARLRYASVLRTMGRNEEAVEEYDRALALDPELHAARHDRALTLAALGRTGEARRELAAMLERNPDDAAARRSLQALGGG
jgi:tetratricopeptide (TPR) repeat protein